MDIVFLLIGLAAGAGAGFFFAKNKFSNDLLEKEVLKRELEMFKSQQDDRSQIREDYMEAAKAAMFEASSKMSSKLLEDHKRENEEARRKAEETTRKETEGIHKEFSQVVEKLHNLKGNLDSQGKKISTVWQALSNPGGAGAMAEIGLENTLKSFGLEAGRDFKTQYSVNYEGNRLRPDAVVFLPYNNLMVIDAKSSKIFLEIAEAAGENEDLLLANLKKTMDNHLSGLAAKSYKDAVASDVDGEIGTVVNVMYLPNEAALQKVFQADPEFRSKCYKKDIILTDPAGLQLLLNICKHEISRAKQEVNYKEILKEMSKVVSSLDMFMRGASAVGDSIKKSADNFAKLGKSVNSRLLPRVKKMIDLGVQPEKEVKSLNGLPDFTVNQNEPNLIEVQTNESDSEKVADIGDINKKLGNG